MGSVFNIEVIKWFLDKQEKYTLKSILNRFCFIQTSDYNIELIKKKIIDTLATKHDVSRLHTKDAFSDVKKNVGLVDYVWLVLCDLSQDVNTAMIKDMIGYSLSMNNTESMLENIQLLKEKVKHLEKTNKTLTIETQQLKKANDELINQKDEQKKEIRISEEKLRNQEKELEALNEECLTLRETVGNLSLQNTYLRNRKSYTSEVINYTDEKQVFKTFVDNARACGLNFNSEDLINFYTSVKSSRLTIIEGISGTGKTKLVDLYSRTLGLDDNNRMIMIPVSPSWTDDIDILGYLDSSNMKYQEASIGLVSFLVEAAKHPDKPYLICFDEMNLAKVEYYFAQFLSILENDVNNRILRIYNPREEKNVVNFADYPSEIRLGENLIFCGTINVDESTYRLSDKVLDRANLIKLQDCDFSVYDDEKPIFKIVDVTLVDKSKSTGLTVDELSLLDELNQKLKEVNPRFCFAHRVVNQIERYLNAIPENDISYTRAKALDTLIVQKILTKIRGTEEQVKDLIGFFEEGSYISGIIDNYLNEDKVDYPIVRKALKDKAKELSNYGYIG